MNHAPAAEPGPPSPDPAEAIARLARASVLVIGDAMLDRYVHGTVTRMIPGTTPGTTPGAIPGMVPGAIPGTPGTPVLTEERELALPGGAANVVRYLTGLGAAVAFISVVGDDPSGSDLTGLVGGQPNVEPWLLVEGGRTTTVKTRYLADGRHLLRADREQTTPIPERLAERVLRIARDAMAATSLTVLSDYGKGVLADGLAARLIAAARESGRPVIAAPPRGASEAELAAYAGADALVLCAAERVAEGGASGTDAGNQSGTDAGAGSATGAGNGSRVAAGIAARMGAGGASEAGAARAAGLRVALGVG
ncbi:MAG: bifunctional heptose 7-phosphate kinase/heptose 1-phosphate adenyltransferase, partial [Acetobacteraceae bacterium]